MFIANKKDGERFSLLEHQNKGLLRKLREHEAFTCPGCQQPVLLRIGNKKIPHFAHHKHAGHCDSFSDPESQYHLLGKMQLYEWLCHQQLSVELEPYLPLIHQRPDLLLSYQGKKFAIEFQCSIIPEDVFLKRTKSYFAKGYLPIWIIGAHHLKRKSFINLQISSFQWLFSQNSVNFAPLIFYYDPVEMQIIKVHHLVPFSPTDSIAHFFTSPLKDFPFSSFFLLPNLKQNSLNEIWFTKKQKWRRTSTRYLFKSNKRFTNELYLHHLFPSCLPAEAGLPLKSQYWIETPAIIWQMYILLDSIFPAQMEEAVTFQTAYQRFLDRKRKGMINIRALPLIKQGHFSFVVMEYLQTLEKLGILKKVKGSTFKKVKSIVTFTNMEDAENADKEILTRLLP